MMSAKRYDPIEDGPILGPAMVESPDGEYVKASDYDDLLAALAHILESPDKALAAYDDWKSQQEGGGDE
jgi:hypothetical protein